MRKALSYGQKFAFANNPGQNILAKSKNIKKIGQERKILISDFAKLFTASAKNGYI